MELQDTIDYHIKSAWHAISRMYIRFLNSEGLTQTTGYVLLHIDEEGLPATKIAPLLGMEPTSLSRLLKSMEDNGLVYREKDIRDKRVVKIYLTQKGKEKRYQAQKFVAHFNKRVHAMLEPHKINGFLETISHIKSLANDLNPDSNPPLDG
jgi:DNA-binding MarR family transcriptional regulator